MFFIKIYIKVSYMNYYDTSIQMCGQYCILAPNSIRKNLNKLHNKWHLTRISNNDSVNI